MRGGDTVPKGIYASGQDIKHSLSSSVYENVSFVLDPNATSVRD